MRLLSERRICCNNGEAGLTSGVITPDLSQSDTKQYLAQDWIVSMVIMEMMKKRTAVRMAEKVQPVRDWRLFAVPNGQVVFRGRYHFAWRDGCFVGAYDTLDDAIESLAFRNRVVQQLMKAARR